MLQALDSNRESSRQPNPTSIERPSMSFQFQDLGRDSRLFWGASWWLKNISSRGTTLRVLRHPASAAGAAMNSSSSTAAAVSWRRSMMEGCVGCTLLCKEPLTPAFVGTASSRSVMGAGI